MADENGAQTAQQQPQVNMKILGQYIRDMSFENILVQKGVTGEVQPELKVEVALDAKKRSTENQYEVLTKYKVTSTNKETGSEMFILELEYAGLFHVENVPEDQLHPFLLIECPRQLFPFARRIVSDVTRDGGFPPVNLDNVDFVALYRQELSRRKETETAPTN